VPVVVLTGGVASGKTAVSEGLAQLGACVVDTDVIARSVTQPGQPGFEAIRQHWGDAILTAGGGADGDGNDKGDGNGGPAAVLDRAKLRHIVFADPAQRKVLESLLHPLIMAEVNNQLAEIPQSACDYAVVVIPLFAENPTLLKPDAVVVVDAPESAQLARLVRRDGIDETLAQQMLDAQASRAQRRLLATDIIDNDQDLQTLDARVFALDQRLKTRFKTRPNATP
jgi:dephospho-CoA kinase